MTESTTKTENKVADMAPLVRRVREFLDGRKKQTTVVEKPIGAVTLAGEFGFTEKKKGKPEVILSEDTAVELGHPSTASKHILLVTFQSELINNGRISIVGPNLDALDGSKKHPFAQVIMIAAYPGRAPDPFELDNAQFLMHRLPGYMVRSVPGRLWVRISDAGRAKELTLKTVGSALIAAYMGDFEGVAGAEVVFVTSSDEDVETLSRVATEAEILSGRHKKLVLGVDGEVECTELNCDTCDEQETCDSLRDVVIKRRKRRK
ncbi:MAG: hypothetical protein ABIH66_14525 [bacterium]